MDINLKIIQAIQSNDKDTFIKYGGLFKLDLNFNVTEDGAFPL